MLELVFCLMIILLTKEFILVNQELIIYIVFLSLTILAIIKFSFLDPYFKEMREFIKNKLKEVFASSLQKMKNNQVKSFFNSIFGLTNN